MKSEFEIAFNEITEQRALPQEMVLEALSTALISAYRRDVGIGNAQRVEAHVDPNTGRARIFVEKEVVRDDVQDVRTEVSLEEARYYDPEADFGDMVMVQAKGTTKNFGRIAAQTAKQVILQKIREAERSALFDEFIDKEGDIVNGSVQSVSAAMVTIGLGRAEAILPRAQQIPGERFKPYDKVRAYVLEVKKTSRGPQIVLSRSHRNMLRRLLEFEVPEIYNGQIEIKNIAREAGYRSKVAVSALQDGIDAVGACVGMRGIRIQNIVRELHDEKIDVIEWNPDQEVFIAKALSPSRVRAVFLDDDPDSGRTAVVIVPDDQLSLAIGKEGQNARLAAKLTGWRIDIKSVTEAAQEAVDSIDRPPLNRLKVDEATLVADVERTLEKKALGRAIMPEEYNVMGRFAEAAQRVLAAQRDAARRKRLAEIEAVKSTLPQGAFQLPITALELPDEIIEALQPLENVGEIMLRFLIDENRLRRMLTHQPAEAMQHLQTALDKLVIPELDAPPELEAPEAEIADAEPLAEADTVSFPEELVAYTEPTAVPSAVEVDPAAVFVDDDDDIDALDKKKGKGKGKGNKGRQLVYDEEKGEMVVKRRRKGARGEWTEWSE